MQTFIYGGCCSGKSTFAENLLMEAECTGKKLYIATMWPEGSDAARRIDRHRRMREGKGFATIERYTALDELLVPAGSAILLECLANLVANEMFRPEGAGREAEATVLRSINALRKQSAHLVIISNEVGSDGALYSETTKAYQDALASLNRLLCSSSDASIEMVCGIPLYLKGGPA